MINEVCDVVLWHQYTQYKLSHTLDNILHHIHIKTAFYNPCTLLNGTSELSKLIWPRFMVINEVYLYNKTFFSIHAHFIQRVVIDQCTFSIIHTY